MINADWVILVCCINRGHHIPDRVTISVRNFFPHFSSFPNLAKCWKWVRDCASGCVLPNCDLVYVWKVALTDARCFNASWLCSFDISQTTIDILKIDIECSEWSSLDTVLTSPQCLTNVKQLMVEFHPCRFRKETHTPQQLLGFWRTLRGIDQLGFKLWRVWNNYYCRFKSRLLKNVQYYGCFNAYYLNVKYLVWAL